MKKHEPVKRRLTGFTARFRLVLDKHESKWGFECLQTATIYSSFLKSRNVRRLKLYSRRAGRMPSKNWLDLCAAMKEEFGDDLVECCRVSPNSSSHSYSHPGARGKPFAGFPVFFIKSEF